MQTWRPALAAPLAAALLAALFAAAPPALAQIQLTGQTSGGAYYRIVAPAGWRPADGLVIWNHGFSLDPIEPDPSLGPLAELQLQEGYAVAASSYSLTGWALFETVADLEEMVRIFETAVGVPEQVLVTGASLGGIVTAQALEEADLGNVVGAYPICGALAGSRVWDGALDLRLLYDLVCGDVPGAAIPGGGQGLPFPPDPSFDELALATAVTLCTGVVLPPSVRSPAQAARLARLLALSGLPEEFLLVDMGFATFALRDLIYDPRKLAGAQPVGNEEVDYGDQAANAGIERVGADPAARRRFLDHFTPAGRVGEVKIVSIHTDKDGLVVVENESAYAAVVPPENLTVGIVVEEAPSHCGFSDAEVAAGWEALRGWVAGLPQPSPAGLQGVCTGLVAGGLAQGPCRFDPGFVLPPFNDRVRPRGACEADDETLCLGDGRFAVRVDWQSRTGPRAARAAPQTELTGSFYFLDPANLEFTVKVLDARPINGHFWVFFGSLTNVEFDLTVTDTETGASKVYRNPRGQFASVGDTMAF